MHPLRPDAVVIGVDTHKDVHVAVAISGLGTRLDATSVPATAHGYRRLAAWAHAHGPVHAFGVEGTGSYGAGLSRALTERGCRVVEVGRPNRQLRRRSGKSDAVDAEAAARAVLAGQADGSPKSGDGEVEMIRHLKVARDTAVKARTQAMVTLKAILVNAPQALRERFIAVTGPMTLIRALAALRPGAILSTMASAKAALRALARRWLALDAEIKEHDAALTTLVRRRAPAPVAGARHLHGHGSRDARRSRRQPRAHPLGGRLRPGLCGVCPIPASSGKTTRHRLNRGGNRQANAALHRVAITRTRCHPATIAYVRRRTAEGKSTREIRRCLKRYIAREVFRHLCGPQGNPRPASVAA